MLVAVNKADREFVDFNSKFLEVQEFTKLDCIPISAKDGTGLENLVISLRALV